MWCILQQDEPEDYVLATGETHTVREFADLAFKDLDLELEWTGEGVAEKGIEKKAGKVRVAVNPKYFRPTEVDLLIGDATKAKKELGWEPRIKFEDLVAKMARADFDKVQKRGF